MADVKIKKKLTSFEIDNDIRAQIKALAAQQDIPLYQWLNQAIADRIAKETGKQP